MSREAIGWLRRYQAAMYYVAGTEEAVWVTRRAPLRVLSYDAYRRVFARVNERNGTDWTPHDLRHTACIRMLDAGIDLYKVSEIMGHVHISTTQKYLRPRLDELIPARHAARQLPQPTVVAKNDYAAADLRTLFGPTP